MGVLWALTSGTGVAVALLVGSVGPLIGVAISASLLPPLVNCVTLRFIVTLDLNLSFNKRFSGSVLGFGVHLVDLRWCKDTTY